MLSDSTVIPQIHSSNNQSFEDTPAKEFKDGKDGSKMTDAIILKGTVAFLIYLIYCIYHEVQTLRILECWHREDEGRGGGAPTSRPG